MAISSQKSNLQIRNQLVAVDFFCSIGGVSCGFRQAGIQVLGGIDNDVSCKETYEANGNGKFLPRDVSTLSKKEVGKFFGIRRGQRNLIFVGCSPCQYYSNIQTDKTKSKNSRLLLADFQEFVEYYRPGYVFIENVPGLETKEGSPLSDFKRFLSENGYSYADKVVDASKYGVPQKRRRYVLVATRIYKNISIPEPDKAEAVTVRDAIAEFPYLEAGQVDKEDPIHRASILNEINLERIQNTNHDGGDRSTWPERLLPNCYKAYDGHGDVYNRLFWDRPSPTITTKFYSYSNGRYGHPEQDRGLSLREGAILQSFPRDYIFKSPSMVTTARMIGNAVPPELAKSIAEAFLK